MPNIDVHKDDAQFMRDLLDEDVVKIESHSIHADRIQQSLHIAIAQKNIEIETDWKRSTTFLALFLFLYAALGASLTLDLSASEAGHKSIEYALQAIPVLIAFSGFFISILFLFISRASARKQVDWEKTIHTLEKYSAGNLFKLTHSQGAGTSNYSLPSIYISLALFICLTWMIIYNYLTFTTSGVFGSVISLFISTMTYVILDIQLLKPFKHAAETTQVDAKKEDENQG